MSIVKRKYFAMFIGAERKWLNEMASKGYRLVRTGKLDFEFEECTPGQYVYEIEYVADKSFEHEKDYKEFLESCGYKVFYKNINLDYSAGKVVWRPFAEKGGQVSTTETTYNKELLIIEKENDGKPFELHTTPADRIKYLRRLRNPWLFTSLVFLIAFGYVHSLWLLALLLICLLPALRFQYSILNCLKEAKGTDAGGPVGESQTFKIILAVALVLAVISFRLGETNALTSSVNMKSGTFIGYVENHYKGVFNMRYKSANGKVIRTVKPDDSSKEIVATISTESGTIGYTVRTQDGILLYEAPEGLINETVVIPTNGEKVVITLFLNKCKGNVAFEYK